MRERERVRSGSRRHEERRHLMLEVFRQTPLRLLGQRVVAIAHGKTVVGADQRLEELGGNPGGIVAGEIHAETSLDCAIFGRRAMAKPTAVDAMNSFDTRLEF